MFTPASEGITAIVGGTGAGKSTIVDSISWALWGSKPSKVRKTVELVRDGATAGKDEVYAQVELDVDGQQYKIRRDIVTKAGGVECNVYVLNDDGGYELLAGPGVSHADPYIRKIMKMDERGFLTAVMVQQKEVDDLISSKDAKKRVQVIEKLTGVSSITEALTNARQEYNSLRKAIKESDFDENTLKNLRDELEKIDENLKTKTVKRDKLADSLSDSQKQVDSLTEQIGQAEKVENQSATLNNRLIKINTELESKRSEFNRVMKQRDEKKKTISRKYDLQQVEQELSNTRGELQTKQVTVSRNEEKISENKNLLESFNKVLASNNISTVDEANSRLEENRGVVENCETRITGLESDNTRLEADNSRIDRAIKVISSDTGVCPTCLQHVDNPASALEALNQEKTNNTETIEANSKVLVKLKTTLGKAESNVSRLQKIVEMFDNSYATDIETLTKQNSLLNGEITVLKSEVSRLDKIFVEAKANSRAVAEYEQVSATAIGLNERIEQLSVEKTTIENELAGLSVVKGLPGLRKKLESANKRLNTLISSHATLREEVSVLATRKEYTERNISEAEVAGEKYRKLLRSVEVASATVDILDEFRQDRVKNSVPVIESYASELLNRFTEGRFVQVILDEKFNVDVKLSNGVVRPVGTLSGGELSATAIALRIAISMMLNSSLMILDEVLVSQDDSRSENILATIKDVCQGQIVMISHGANTKQVADKVVEL